METSESVAQLYEVRLPSGLRACSKIGRWGPMCSYLTERAVQIRTGQVGQPRGAARNDDEPRVLLLPDIEHISIHSCRIIAWHLGSMLICQYALWSNSSTSACQPEWEMLLLATPSCFYPWLLLRATRSRAGSTSNFAGRWRLAWRVFLKLLS